MAARAGMIGRAGPRAATAYVAISGDFSILHKQLAAQSSLLSKRGNKVGKVMGASLAAGAAGAVAAGGALFKLGEQFDAAQDKIRVNTGKTGKNLARLQRDFKAVVKDVPTDFESASTAVAGLNQRLGVTGRPLRRLAKQMTELSRITGTDINENVASITRLFGDWSVKTGKQSQTLDKLFRVSQATGIQVSELARLMVQFGSPLRQLGLSFDFSAAMFARFEKEGVNIQTLLPGLRFALKTFSKEGREPAKALRETFRQIENTGSAAKANQLAFETFGVRAGPDMAAAIREGRFDLDKLMKTMRSGEDTIRSAGRDTEDFTEKWIRFRNRAMVKLEPVATRVFQRVTKEADAFFKILEDPKLTADEKFAKVLDRVGDLITDITPKIAEKAATAAPKVALAFARGFINAPAWSQLAIGGFLLAKFGGKKAISALGGKVATTLFGGMLGGGAAGGLGKGAISKAAPVPVFVTNPGFGGTPGGKPTGGPGGIFGKLPKGKLLPILARGAGVVGFTVATAELLQAAGARFPDNNVEPRSPEARRREAQTPSGRPAGSSGSIFGRDSSELRREGLRGSADVAVNEAKTAAAVAKGARQQQAAHKALRDSQRLTRAASKLTGEQLARDMRASSAQVSARLEAIRKGFRALRGGAATNLNDLREITRNNLSNIAKTMGTKSDEGRAALSRNFRLSLRAVQDMMASGKVSSKQGMAAIRDLIRVHSGRGKDALKANMDEIRTSIRRTMARSKAVTEEGVGLLRDLYVKELRMYGLSPKDAIASASVRADRGLGPNRGGQRRGDFQRGGPITWGKPVGDSVPAMLEKGEYVLNRKAVAKAGKQQLDALNFGAAPRFQRGGMAGMVAAANKIERASFPYEWGGGHQASPAPFVPFDCSGAVSYVLQHGGIKIPTMTSGQMMGIGQGGAGKVTIFANPGHVLMRIGNRFFGTSNTNPGGGAGWIDPAPSASYLAGFVQRHFDAAGGVGMGGGDLPQIDVKGPASLLKGVVQGAIDKTRKAAVSKLGDLAATTMGGGDFGDFADIGGSGAALMKAISRERGWNFGDWWELDRRESSHGQNLVNPTSTARLRGQFLDMNWGRYGPGSDPRQNPSMREQIISMARYIAERYTNPTRALRHHDAHNWYAKGGLVGMVGDSLGVGTVNAGLSGKIGGRLRADVKESRTATQGAGLFGKYKGKDFTQFIFDLGTNPAGGSKGEVGAALGRVDRMTGSRPLLAMMLKGAKAGALSGVGSNDVHVVRWPGELGPDGVHPADYGSRASALARAVKKFAPKNRDRKAKPPKKGNRKKLPTGLKPPRIKKLNEVITALRFGDQAERSKQVHSFLDRVKGTGLPKRMEDRIAGFETFANIAGEMASRASMLTFDPVDPVTGEPKLDAERRPITQWGEVGGKNEIQWLTDQLTSLFALRNAIIRAQDTIVARRDQLTALLEHAKKRAHEVSQRIVKEGRRKRRLEKEIEQGRDRLERLRKHPRKNREKIAKLRKEVMGKVDEVKSIENAQEGRVRVRDWLTGGIKDALTDRRSALNTLRGEHLTNLEAVHGLGSPMDVMKVLPPIGVLGGTIFDVQNQLRELQIPKLPILDPGLDPTDTTDTTDQDALARAEERASLLEGLVREANQRTAVSEKQFEVLKNFPDFGGTFHTGGIVPGPYGQERTAILQGGEGVFTPDQMAAMGGAGEVRVIVHGDILSDRRDPVEVVIGDRRFDAAVERSLRRPSRIAGRGLAGRGGGQLR